MTLAQTLEEDVSQRTLVAGRIKVILANSLLVAASLVVIALVSEVMLTIFVPILYHARVTRVDPLVGWTHNPSVSVAGDFEGYPRRVSYNKHGYRMPEHTLRNLNGQTRIVVLGDSYVDGYEVDDHDLHTVHLQQTMTGVEVINFGVYGYSTAQELITLEQVALPYGPDLVVLITISNDFIDNVRNFSHFGPAPRFRLDADSVALEPTTGQASRDSFQATNLPIPWLMAFLHQHSTLYYVVNHYLYQQIIDTRIATRLADQVHAVSPEDRVELYRRLVMRMKRVAEDAGADFLVVFAYLRDEVLISEASPNVGLASSLSVESVAILDLFDDLREAELSSGESLWYQEDIHWNARGHRVVSELLRPILQEHLKRRNAVTKSELDLGE